MIAVCVEIGARGAFASALDWPGWSRAGRDEAGALELLAIYAPRYQSVAAQAGHPVPGLEPAISPEVATFEVAERVVGDATTDFGVPGKPASVESAPLEPGLAGQRVLLLRSCWAVLDEVAASAPPDLQKGPRGGGRDRDDVVRHVCAAEVAYARKLGVRDKEVLGSGEQRRSAIAEVLGRPSDGAPVVERGWCARYGARRIAWHVLDHAWEIEDRSAR